LNKPNPPRRRGRAFDWSTATIAALAFTAAAIIYWRDGREHFLAVLGGDITLLGNMLPKVLAGCLIAAFVTMIVPRELVARWVGHESGFAGLLIAAAFGFILPGGPITIYPIAGAFVAMGADAGRIYPRSGVGTAVLRAALRDLAHRRSVATADCRRATGAHRTARRLCAS
jgi:hypothetical protein